MQAMNITSREIFEKTMQRVAPLPCQASYARNLARILSMHINRNKLIDEGWHPDELPSMSAIVVAPTGQGKTYLVRKMAEAMGLHLITIDCSTLVPEGWKGVSLSQRLAAAANSVSDKATFAKSVLFFDEIDKIRISSDAEWANARMSNILQMFNGGTIEAEVDRKAVSFKTDRFLLLFGGAFVGLEDIIRNRVCPKSAAKIGFSVDSENAGADEAELSVAELMRQATVEDLTKYGIIPELLGRVGSVLSIQPMGIADYRQLLTADTGSLTAKYRAYLKALYGIGFEISEAGVEEIAARCMKAETGARAATPLINDLMRGAISAVEEDDAICKVVLAADEDGCCVRYEHGPREPVLQFGNRQARHPAATAAEAKLPTHTVKSNNQAACVRSLLRYYRNAGGNLEETPALKPFLTLTVRFLHEKCKPGEFTLMSMVKLAEAVQKNRKSGKSPYDIIMSDYRYTSLPEYEALSKSYDIWTARELVKSLNTIRNYLYEKHGPCQVRFVIPRGK